MNFPSCFEFSHESYLGYPVGMSWMRLLLRQKFHCYSAGIEISAGFIVGAGGAQFDFQKSSNLQPLASSCKWLQVAASGCKWLLGQVAASGSKWLQVATWQLVRAAPFHRIHKTWKSSWFSFFTFVSRFECASCQVPRIMLWQLPKKIET